MAVDIASVKELRDVKALIEAQTARLAPLLEQVLAEQRRTNQLLEWVGQRLPDKPS